MSRKRPTGRAGRPAIARPRDERGRFLSKRQIAAYRGVQTRRRNEKAKDRAVAERVKASKHGERARKQTAAKLTEAQIERRRRDARRVTQKVRRAKKEPRGGQVKARPSSRLPISPRWKDRSKISTSKRAPSTEITIGRGDAFAAQIAVRFKMPAGFVPTKALVSEAIAYRIEHGEDAPRVKTKILRWRNPGRRRGEDRSWRHGNQSDAWETLGVVIKAALVSR